MKAFQLKMVIKNSKPPIWRRLIVPAGITFSQLGMILNKAMGWSGGHLFEFEFYHLELCITEDPDDEIGYGPFDYLEARTTFIREYLEQNDWFTYTYDLGDDWQHRVTVEKIITDYEENFPKVIKYKGACPVEDCGGIYGYYECLDIINNPENPEYKDRLTWMQQQGYSPEYDMELVNEELKNQFYYIWGKAEHRRQLEIMEEHWSGRYGLRAAKRDKNKTAAVMKSGKHKMEDAMQMAADMLKQKIFTQRPEGVSLKSIMSDFSVEEIRDIAENKEVRGINGCGKVSLISKLTDFMLRPEVMERYFLCLQDYEIEAFEKAVNAPEFYKDTAQELGLLYYAGYIGMLTDGRIVVPCDVAEAYRLLKGQEFTEKRKKCSYVFCCLKAVEILYGIAPVNIVMKLVAADTEINITEQEFCKIVSVIPPEFAKFVIKDGMVYHTELYPNDRGLMEAQGNRAYYIPTREEIIDLGTKGYLPNNKELKKLVRYLVQKMKSSQEDAEITGMLIQNVISGDCRMQDVFDILESNDIEIENEKQMHELVDLISNLWNHTRMLLNRGFMPCELCEDKAMDIPRPQKDNLVDFEKMKKKKVYPNDPCPCGSGKKYKHCCQNK